MQKIPAVLAQKILSTDTFPINPRAMGSGGLMDKVLSVARYVLNHPMEAFVKVLLATSGFQSAHRYSSILPVSSNLVSNTALLAFPGLWISGVGAQSTFYKTLGGSNDDVAQSLATDSNGESFMVGYTQSFGAGKWDIFASNWLENGTIGWKKTFGGSGDEQARDMALTNDEGIVIAGYTNSTETLQDDAFVLKLWKQNGTIAWRWFFGGSDTDRLEKITTLSDDSIVAIGWTRNNGAGQVDALVTRWGGNGTSLWIKTFGGGNDELGVGLTRTASGGFLTLLESITYGVGNNDLLLSEWFLNGTVLWSTTLGGTGDDRSYGLIITDGWIVAAGLTNSFGVGNYDVLLSKWQLNGTFFSADTIGGGGNDYSFGITKVPDGGLVIAGMTTSSGSGMGDALAFKWWPTNRTIDWAKTLGGAGDDWAAPIATASNGSVVFGCYTNSSGMGKNDATFAKITNDGEMYNCSYLQDMLPTITDITALINVTNPTITPQSWSPTIHNWTSLTEGAISQAPEELCFPEPPPVTTGVVTTGQATTGSSTTGVSISSSSPSALITTGTSTTGQASSPSETHSSRGAASPSTKQPSSLPWIIAGSVGGLALVCIAGIGSVWYFMRRRSHKESSNTIEMDGSSDKPSPIGGTTPTKGEKSRLSSDRDEGRTVIGKKYGLVRKINREEAEELFQQTGIQIKFPDLYTNKTKPLLGAGRFGKLRIAVVEGTKFVAVKKIKGEDEIAASQQEATLQMKLEGLPNVMPLFDSVETKASNGAPVLYQFMPLAGFGNGETLQISLRAVTDIALKQKVLTHVAKGVLTGLSGMHEKSIVHLDLKNANIVFDMKGEVLIIDFGCALEVADINNIEAGSGDIAYFSPGRLAFYRKAFNTETKKNLPINESYSGVTNDLWALGLMLIEQMTGSLPLPRVPLNQKLESWDYDWMMSKLSESLNKSKQAYPELCDLIEKLLEADRKGNVNAAQLLKHPLFKDKNATFRSTEERENIFSHFKANMPQAQAENSSAKNSAHKKKSEDEEYVQSHYAAKGMKPVYHGKTSAPAYGLSPNAPEIKKSSPAQPTLAQPKGEEGYVLNN